MSKFFIFAPNDDNMYYYNPEGIVYIKFYKDESYHMTITTKYRGSETFDFDSYDAFETAVKSFRGVCNG